MRRISFLAVLVMFAGVAFAQAPAKKTIYTYVQGNGVWDKPYKPSSAPFFNDSTAEWALGYVQGFASQPRISMGTELFFEAGLSPEKPSTISGIGAGFGNVGVPVAIRAKVFANVYGVGLYIDTRFFLGVSYTWSKSVNANGTFFVGLNAELNMIATSYNFIDDLSVTVGYAHNLGKGFSIGTDIGLRFAGSTDDMQARIRWNVVNVGWSYDSFALAATLRLEPRINMISDPGNGQLRIGTYGSFRYSFDIK